MSETIPTITERLDLHNQSVLITSAQKKLADGKRLTVAERKAVADATHKKQRGVELPFMRHMPKKEYIERFGGSNRVYLEWERRWAFPWNEGEKFVNCLEILCWYREHVAAGTESSSVDVDDHAGRLKKYQADRELIKLEKDRGSVLPIEEVEADLRTYAGIIQEAIESLEAVSPDAYRIMCESLDKVMDEFSRSDSADPDLSLHPGPPPGAGVPDQQQSPGAAAVE